MDPSILSLEIESDPQCDLPIANPNEFQITGSVSLYNLNIFQKINNLKQVYTSYSLHLGIIRQRTQSSFNLNLA